MDRTKNSLINIVFGLGGQLLNIAMSFAMRTVLINILGTRYSGINGLFTNIMMVFSLADLGVGTAIIYSMYKPIAEHNVPMIQSLMRMYGTAYRTIGFAIIALGLALTPFLDKFVLYGAGEVAIPEDLRVIFLLFVANTASTYFFAYKGTLITAHQKNYIVTNIVFGTSILCYGAQILILVLTEQYILTQVVQVATNVIQNIIIMKIADKMFPYIKGNRGKKLKSSERQKIYKNMGSLIFYRMGQVIINGTDSIVISSLISISVEGLNANYVLLTTTVKNLLLQIFRAITASIGNFTAVETLKRKYKMYNIVYFGNFWMFGFSSVCFYVLLNPFIELWIGKDMLLSDSAVSLIVLNFYMIGMRNVTTTFRDTMGIFKEGRFIPLLAAVVNIGVSVWLAPMLGIEGVFIGTIVSTVTTLFWMEPIVLFKYGFKRKATPYFTRYLLYFLATVAAAYLTRLASCIFTELNVFTFLGMTLICMILPNLIFVLCFARSKEFYAIYGIVVGRIMRMIKK